MTLSSCYFVWLFNTAHNNAWRNFDISSISGFCSRRMKQIFCILFQNLRWDNNIDSHMNVLCLRPFDSQFQVSVDWCCSTLSVLLPWRSVWQHCSQVCETRQAKTHLRITRCANTHTHTDPHTLFWHITRKSLNFSGTFELIAKTCSWIKGLMRGERWFLLHVSVMLPCPTWIPLLIATWLTGRRRNPAFISPGFSSSLKEGLCSKVSAKTGLGFVKEKRIEIPLCSV